jgi:hypothetical protein
MPIYIIYIFIISLAFGCKNGKLYIFFTLSRLDESRHKIITKIMKKLVYIKNNYIKIYKNIIIYCPLIFNFQIVLVSFVLICLKCK